MLFAQGWRSEVRKHKALSVAKKTLPALLSWTDLVSTPCHSGSERCWKPSHWVCPLKAIKHTSLHPPGISEWALNKHVSLSEAGWKTSLWVYILPYYTVDIGGHSRAPGVCLPLIALLYKFLFFQVWIGHPGGKEGKKTQYCLKSQIILFLQMRKSVLSTSSQKENRERLSSLSTEYLQLHISEWFQYL